MPEQEGIEWTRHDALSPRQLSSSEVLLTALDAHDPPTAQHSRNAVRLAEAVAERLGLTPAERGEVILVAMLHDLGKVTTPRPILEQPGPLSPADLEVVQQHSAAGGRLVAEVDELADLEPLIRATHERWDGLGYPDGLAGAEIPLASRVTFVCDAYDAMTSDRPYRRAMSAEGARQEIERCAGTQFCPASAEAMLDVLGERSRTPAGPADLRRPAWSLVEAPIAAAVGSPVSGPKGLRPRSARWRTSRWRRPGRPRTPPARRRTRGGRAGAIPPT